MCGWAFVCCLRFRLMCDSISEGAMACSISVCRFGPAISVWMIGFSSHSIILGHRYLLVRRLQWGAQGLTDLAANDAFTTKVAQ